MRQLKQEKQGVTPKASPHTPERIEIPDLKKRISELEEHNEIIKKGHPEVTFSKRLVELAGVEPASKNHSSLVLHA
ncbi:hypothetical protein VHP8226_00587 [Vibrio hippocampi]|uniref:Transposase n=1 Tax=Vibrio hippocampi TaxID=654686 RepID=A0ABM8ZFC1_9VIBR|nr:hypothetical protein VHP8226_00587 [Vibrio hippocampi]